MNNISKGVDDSKIQEYKDYVNCVVHDMKMPISANINSTNLLLKGMFGELSKEQMEVMELMQGSNNFLKNLVNIITITDIIEEGKYKLEPEDFDLYEMVNSLVRQNKNLHNEKSQIVKITNNLQKRTINADNSLIKRVISNLLGNANKYGANKSTIEITLQSNEETVEFSITNKNRFPEYNKKLITFQKYDCHKSNCGSGLGLYFCRLAIASHHRIIFAEYPPHNKTKITFKIPIK